MMSFIKKDFLIVKANIKTFLTMIVIYTIMIFLSNQPFSISFVLPFLTIFIVFSTFNYDEFNNWDAYSITFPSGRENSIRGKYIGTVSMLILTGILGTIISGALGIYNDMFDLEELIVDFLTTLTFMIILISFTYPLIYKLGVEKGRLAMFVIAFGGIGVLTALIKLIGNDAAENIFNFLDDWYYIVLPAISIVFLLISYFISIKIYSKKEF